MFCSFDYKFFCFSSKEHQWISSFAGSGSGSEPGYFQTKVLFPNVFNNFCCLSMEEKIANRFGAKQIFSRSGSRTVLISPIRTLIWSKKVCNCAFLGLFYTLSMSTHSVSWHWQFLPLTPCPSLPLIVQSPCPDTLHNLGFPQKLRASDQVTNSCYHSALESD